MKRILIAAVAALSMVGSAQAAEKLRVGTEGAYPPFNFIGSDGKLAGFDVDIANAICDTLEMECVFVKQDWDGIIPGLLAKKYDVIVASMSITDERKKAVDFTYKYYTNKLQFVGKKGMDLKPTLKTLGRLKGKTVGAQRSTISSSFLEDNMKDIVDIKLYDSQINANLDLASGRVDLMLADRLVSYDWLKTDEGKGFDFVGEALDIDDNIGIAIGKGRDDLRDRISAAIATIRFNGIYERINAKYFPFSIY